MLRINLLGATGSVGSQSLEVIRLEPEKFVVTKAAINNNIQKLVQICAEFKTITKVAIYDQRAALSFEREHPQIQVFVGAEGLVELCRQADYDLLLNALVGQVGVEPTKAAVLQGKVVALANKESLVAAGEEIMALAQKSGAEIRPVDSEHSAIWQCLRGEKQSAVQKIILTCSGGPFRDASKWPLERLKAVKAKEALKHPNWSMGAKISIDSATLMNKALEVIEAVRLFAITPEQIEVVIHPQSIMHSAVEYVDGSVIAQLGTPDMRTAIALALSAPSRMDLPFSRLNLFNQRLEFEPVDHERFLSINFAFEALSKGESACKALNEANEEAVQLFLAGEIGFLEILTRVGKAI